MGIGEHAPEFGFEKERANVENAIRELEITVPVAIDVQPVVSASSGKEDIQKYS